MRLIVVVLAVAAGWPVFGQTPEIDAATAENFAICRDAGGDPRVRPEYARSADLNGDGRPDYVIDLAGLDCAGAAAYFCGSAAAR